jgi:hypothetical protein
MLFPSPARPGAGHCRSLVGSLLLSPAQYLSAPQPCPPCAQEPLALLQGWVHDFEALQLRHSPATLTSLVKVHCRSHILPTIQHLVIRVRKVHCSCCFWSSSQLEQGCSQSRSEATASATASEYIGACSATLLAVRRRAAP